MNVMRIIEDLSDFPSNIQTVVTSGTFDGVHQGHHKILQQVVEMAKSSERKSVLLTYWPHPRFVLHQNDESLKLLTTFDEKAELIKSAGIDYLVRIPFTEEFSQLEADEFVRKILIDHLNTTSFVIGYDHHFGKNRSGNFEYLQQNATEFGFEVVEIPRQDIDDVGVSSTKIREALKEGRVDDAANLLGRPYSLRGQVVEGDQLGRSIGFPTANIWVPEGYKLIPASGSYATEVLIGDEWQKGMTNIGVRPTINGSQRRIEVNILNFDRDIYGLDIQILFVRKLRDEQKFENMNVLKAQLERDREETIKILKK